MRVDLQPYCFITRVDDFFLLRLVHSQLRDLQTVVGTEGHDGQTVT